MKNVVFFIFWVIIWSNNLLLAQGIPAKVNYEPDEGGYPNGYTPARKLGKFDLSSRAANEPFRHLNFFLSHQKTVWDGGITDFRDFGFRAEFQALGKPKENSYSDLNEAYFRDPIAVAGRMISANPIYSPDPNRTLDAQGRSFKAIGGISPTPTITIEDLNNDSKWNPFLLSSEEVELRARAVANPMFGYLRWDIEQFNPYDVIHILKGRQVWSGGKYRHAENGGNDPEFREMSDGQFYEYVLEAWSTHFIDLFTKTKDQSQGSKIWKYGCGPIQTINPNDLPQFDDQGAKSVYWARATQAIWAYKNKKYGKSVGEVLDYLESWDFIPDTYHWAITRYDVQNRFWAGTDLILLQNLPQNITTKGRPTRYLLTDIGTNEAGNRLVRVSLHAQDGSLRVADQDYRVIFDHPNQQVSTVIPTGKSSVEIATSTPEQTITPAYRNKQDDIFLNRIWTTTYCARLHEPTKLGFINWELTPRVHGLQTSDMFEQRVYDAVVALANLQNFGVVHWDASLSGKLQPMVRESLILAHRKIAPYKSHIENQSLCFVDISMDNGQTWVLGGYPDEPFQQRYNGWLLAGLIKEKKPAPMISATYNAQQKTVLVAHLGCGTMPPVVNYKIRVRLQNSTVSFVTDLSTTRELKYNLFVVP